jgi:hypothetical protein
MPENPIASIVLCTIFATSEKNRKNKNSFRCASYRQEEVMDKKDVAECEKEVLNLLLETEDLAEKKMRVYSRLLTEQSLAETMKELSSRHTARKRRIEELVCGKKKKGEEQENEA